MPADPDPGSDPAATPVPIPESFFFFEGARTLPDGAIVGGTDRLTIRLVREGSAMDGPNRMSAEKFAALKDVVRTILEEGSGRMLWDEEYREEVLNKARRLGGNANDRTA